MGARLIENSSVLVTGGAGFIGSNLCEALLRQGNKVVCLDNFLTGGQENIEPFLTDHNFTLIEGDIRNLKDCETAVQGAKVVLHQAALGSVPRSVADPLTTNSINITGFLNVLWAAKEAGVKRVVYATSSSVYGDAKESPKLENHIGKPLSPYAVTKQVNEQYAQVFADLYGLETIGLRYFNVFGKNQPADGAYAAAIPKFIKLMLKEESPIIYGDGSQTRDFTYIENVVQANQLAAVVQDSRAVNEIYNIAYGESTTLNDVVKHLKAALSIEEIDPIYTDERMGEVKHSVASIEKARSLLAYDPTHSFQQGLEEAVSWYSTVLI